MIAFLERYELLLKCQSQEIAPEKRYQVLRFQALHSILWFVMRLGGFGKMQIFISRNNQQHGPYNLDDIQAYLASGHLHSNDLAWYEGVQGWVPLSQIPGIATPQNRVPPPPPQIVPINQEKLPAKKPITTFQKVVLGTFGTLLLFGMVGSSIDSRKQEQREAQKEATLLAKQQNERVLARKRAASIAANPKLAKAEREKTRQAKEERARKAAQRRREREAAEKAAQEVRVENSAFDGAVPQVVAYLKQTLRDFDSAEWIEWSPVEKVSGMPYKFRVRCKYRAENGFGGKTIANQIFMLDANGQVVNIIDLQ